MSTGRRDVRPRWDDRAVRARSIVAPMIRRPRARRVSGSALMSALGCLCLACGADALTSGTGAAATSTSSDATGAEETPTSGESATNGSSSSATETDATTSGSTTGDIPGEPVVLVERCFRCRQWPTSSGSRSPSRRRQPCPRCGLRRSGPAAMAWLPSLCAQRRNSHGSVSSPGRENTCGRDLGRNERGGGLGCFGQI